MGLFVAEDSPSQVGVFEYRGEVEHERRAHSQEAWGGDGPPFPPQASPRNNMGLWDQGLRSSPLPFLEVSVVPS